MDFKQSYQRRRGSRKLWRNIYIVFKKRKKTVQAGKRNRVDRLRHLMNNVKKLSPKFVKSLEWKVRRDIGKS